MYLKINYIFRKKRYFKRTTQQELNVIHMNIYIYRWHISSFLAEDEETWEPETSQFQGEIEGSALENDSTGQDGKRNAIVFTGPVRAGWGWARNEFQEERQRVCNDSEEGWCGEGNSKTEEKKGEQERKRGRNVPPADEKTNLTSHFHREVAAPWPKSGEDKGKRKVYVLFLFLSRRSNGYYQTGGSKGTYLLEGDLRGSRETEETPKSFEF